MKKFRIFLPALFLLLVAACTVDAPTAAPTAIPSALPPTIVSPSPTASPTATTTPTPIIQYIEVTRVVASVPVEMQPVATVPAAVQECFNQAMSQVEINGCAAFMRQLAEDELYATFRRISLPEEEQAMLEQILVNWQNLAWQDCEFLYGQFLTDSNGHEYYARGSSAPMHMSICIEERTRHHIQELKYAYLSEW
jgi:uncharacterized protein YecT (DUF1311 family)